MEALDTIQGLRDQGLEFEDFDMIRPLLFSQKELKDNPLRALLQKETLKVAKQAAERHKPTAILDLQANIDEDAEAILLAGADRIEVLLRDKNHYFYKGEDLRPLAKFLSSSRRASWYRNSWLNLTSMVIVGLHSALEWLASFAYSGFTPRAPCRSCVMPWQLIVSRKSASRSSANAHRSHQRHHSSSNLARAGQALHHP